MSVLRHFFLTEVSLKQTLERLAVSSLIAGHLMHGVMDRVKVGGLCPLGKIKLTGGSAVLGLPSHLKDLLSGDG